MELSNNCSLRGILLRDAASIVMQSKIADDITRPGSPYIEKTVDRYCADGGGQLPKKCSIYFMGKDISPMVNSFYGSNRAAVFFLPNCIEINR